MLKLNKTKRILTLLMSFVMLALILYTTIIPASAEKVRVLLTAGDAITSGKGLDDRVAKCYSSLLAAQLGISSKNYENIAEDSMSSASFIDKLPLYEIEIQDSDLMVISIGVDDILTIIASAIEATANGSMSYAKLIEYAADADFVNRLNEAIDHTAMLNTVAKYSVNVGEIIKSIRTYNPDIRIVFLSLYNPFDGASSLVSLKSLFASSITMMNEALNKTAGENGCQVIDLATAFAGQANQMTNITSLDTSPNVEGHKLIAQLLTDYISTLEDLPEETTATETAETTFNSEITDTDDQADTTSDPLDIIISPPESHTWVYIVIAVCVAGTGIAIGIISMNNKSKKK